MVTHAQAFDALLTGRWVRLPEWKPNTFLRVVEDHVLSLNVDTGEERESPFFWGTVSRQETRWEIQDAYAQYAWYVEEACEMSERWKKRMSRKPFDGEEIKTNPVFDSWSRDDAVLPRWFARLESVHGDEYGGEVTMLPEIDGWVANLYLNREKIYASEEYSRDIAITQVENALIRAVRLRERA